MKDRKITKVQVQAKIASIKKTINRQEDKGGMLNINPYDRKELSKYQWLLGIIGDRDYTMINDLTFVHCNF
jgi:hypothetical protein